MHADMRATANLLRQRVFGDRAWVEKSNLANGPVAFNDLQFVNVPSCGVLVIRNPLVNRIAL